VISLSHSTDKTISRADKQSIPSYYWACLYGSRS